MAYKEYMTALYALQDRDGDTSEPEIPFEARHRLSAVLKAMQDSNLTMPLAPEDVISNNNSRDPALIHENTLLAGMTGLNRYQVMQAKEFIAEAAEVRSRREKISLADIRKQDIQKAQEFIADNGPLPPRQFAVLGIEGVEGKAGKLVVEVNPLSPGGYDTLDRTTRGVLLEYGMPYNDPDGTLAKQKIQDILDKRIMGKDPLNSSETPEFTSTLSSFHAYFEGVQYAPHENFIKLADKPLEAFENLDTDRRYGGHSIKDYISKAVEASVLAETPISMNPASKNNAAIARRAGMSMGALMDSAKTMVFSGIAKIKDNGLDIPANVKTRAIEFARDVTISPTFAVLKVAFQGARLTEARQSILKEAKRLGSDVMNRLKGKPGAQDSLGLKKMESLIIAEASPFSRNRFRSIGHDVAHEIGVSPAAVNAMNKTLAEEVSPSFINTTLEVGGLTVDQLKELMERTPGALEKINEQNAMPDQSTLSSALQNDTLEETMNGRSASMDETIDTLKKNADALAMEPGMDNDQRKKAPVYGM